MRQEMEAFLSYLGRERGYSRNTVTAYRNDLAQMLDFIETESGGPVGTDYADILKAYLLKLREKRYSPATMARKIASTRSFFKFMVDSGRLGENPTQNLLSPRVSRHSPTYLSPAEYQRLLAEPTKVPTPEAQRDVVMLELLHATGLRISELVALDVRDIDLDQSRLRCGRGDGGREVCFGDRVCDLLRGFIRNHRLDLLYDEKEEALFLNRRGARLTRQGFWQIMKDYASQAGLGDKVTPHTLRHSFAREKLQSGADLHSVQQLLGHAYISSTKVYRQAAPR